MKTKPFNLEEALNGAKIVTRDGREVTQLTKFDVNLPSPILGVVKNEDGINRLSNWKNCGSYYDTIESNHDLFIAVEPIKTYVNIYSNGKQVWVGTGAFNSEIEAKSQNETSVFNTFYIKTIEITDEP